MILHLSYFHKRRILNLSILIVCLCPISAWAQFLQEDIAFQAQDQNLPWNLKSKTVQVQKKQKVVIAKGDVLLTQGNNTLQADYARFYWDINWVYLKGNIRAKWNNDLIQAQEAELDLKHNVGWVTNGTLFLPKPHLYFKGQYLEKTSKSTYKFKQARVTSCDGKIPAWSLYSQKGKITLDGYARLWHPRLKVKKWSTLYSPYLLIPVKTKRSSGFLMPQFSQSSRLGTIFNLPYYQVINEEQDMTYYFNYMSNRGLMLGSEYRLTPNLKTQGIFQLDWLQDRETADTEKEEDDQFIGDGLVRDNQTRYWFRGKFNGFLFNPEWKTKLDFDLVSDQNYLREFDSGYCGFDRSRENFLEEFGRDINDKDDLKRENIVTLSRNWANFGFAGQIFYNQNTRYMNDNLDSDQDPTLQRLPELNFDFYQQPLFDTPLRWEAENEITHFWKRFGDTWTRTDINPKLSLPFTTKYATFIPKLGFRETFYYRNQEENHSGKNDSYSREIWEIEANAFTEGYRIFTLRKNSLKPISENKGKSYWSKIKHSIRPEIDYTYIPNFALEEDVPQFDSIDEIQETNKITFNLTNVLTRRKDSIVATPGKDQFALDKNYLDFLRLEIEQSYDFEEADRDENLDQYSRRPFSDIRTEISFRPCPAISLDQTTWFSPYIGDITEHEHMLQMHPFSNFRAYFGWDYQRELTDDIHRKNQQELSILRAGGFIGLSERWTVSADYERDLSSSELIEQRLGVGYKHQCWNLHLNYFKTQDETSVQVLITLKQLGEFGQEFAVR